MKEYEQKIYNIINNAKGDVIFHAHQAYKNGYKDGYVAGYDHGKRDGYEAGKADTPFTDTEEAEEKAYNRGLNEAWEAARKIIEDVIDGGYSSDVLREIFGISTIQPIFKLNNASEAIKKLAEYEDKQKQDAEIKVGDEIRLHDAIEVVTQVMLTGLQTIDASGNTSTWFYATYPLEAWKKTGRHFDAIAEVLKEMRDAE